MNIEWIYEKTKVAPPLPNGSSHLPSALPLGSDLDELISLGEIGHVLKIHQKLDAIAADAPECTEFVTQVRSWVNAFEFKRYVAALEAIRADHAHR